METCYSWKVQIRLRFDVINLLRGKVEVWSGFVKNMESLVKIPYKPIKKKKKFYTRDRL